MTPKLSTRKLADLQLADSQLAHYPDSYVLHSSKKWCSFSTDVVVQTVQALFCLGMPARLPFSLVRLCALRRSFVKMDLSDLKVKRSIGNTCLNFIFTFVKSNYVLLRIKESCSRKSEK